MPALSVIICAHNPRAEYLRQTLAALEAQTLPREQWELLLVDNASREPLAARWDLKWHPQARHIREDELGLTPARLRGIREAIGEVFVFVDDDNLLAPDYLQQATEIARGWPMLGAWGGRIVGRYETPPPAWATPYLGMLAIREFTGNRWSNSYDDGEARPCGAGMVVRRSVATVYASKVCTDPLRLGLGRKGASLVSCEDSDLALTAIDLGLGVGMFDAMQLEHLIPAGRLEESYLLKLTESMAFSHVLLASLRSRPVHVSWFRQALGFARLKPLNLRAIRFERARQRGQTAGLKHL